MVPPLIFGHSVQTNMAEGGPKLKNQWGSNKIENVPICLGNTHVDCGWGAPKSNI